MLLGNGYVYALFLSEAGLAQFACVFVCLLVGGDLIKLRVLFRVAVCQSALVRLGVTPLLWCVMCSYCAPVPREYKMGY